MIKKIETKIESTKEKIYTPMPPIEVPSTERHKSVEITTLTEIPNKMPEFPLEFVKPAPIVTPKQFKEEIITEHRVEIEKPKMREAEQTIEGVTDEPTQGLLRLTGGPLLAVVEHIGGRKPDPRA